MRLASLVASFVAATALINSVAGTKLQMFSQITKKLAELFKRMSRIFYDRFAKEKVIDQRMSEQFIRGEARTKAKLRGERSNEVLQSPII